MNLRSRIQDILNPDPRGPASLAGVGRQPLLDAILGLKVICSLSDQSRGTTGLQELHQQLVDLSRPFLLNPVPRARNNRELASVWHRDAYRVAADHRDYRIMLAGCEHRGLTQLGALEKTRQLPVAIEIAIPVNTAAKAHALELPGKKTQVRLSQPARQPFGLDAGFDEGLAARE